MKATQSSAMQWPSSPPSLLRGRTNVPPVQSQRRVYSDSNDMGEAPHAASPVVQGPNHLTFNRINSYGGQSFNGLKNGTLSRSRSPATHGQSLISEPSLGNSSAPAHLSRKNSLALQTSMVEDDSSLSHLKTHRSNTRSQVSHRRKSVVRNTAHSDTVTVLCRVRPFVPRELEISAANDTTTFDENKSVEGLSKAPSSNNLNATPEPQLRRQLSATPYRHGQAPDHLKSVISMDGKNLSDVLLLDHQNDYAVRRAFNFDTNIWSIPRHQQAVAGLEPQGQEDVMRLVGLPAVNNLWDGYNTCIFAYGQTGSGKTHTMMGPPDDIGLIPRICRKIFSVLEEKRKSEEDVVSFNDGTGEEKTMKVSYRMEASFKEIYNEKVKDLLWQLNPSLNKASSGAVARARRASVFDPNSTQKLDSTMSGTVTDHNIEKILQNLKHLTNLNSSVSNLNLDGTVSGDSSSTAALSDLLSQTSRDQPIDVNNLKIRHVPNRGPIVVGLTKVAVDTSEDCLRVIEEGDRWRATAMTNMNEHSSRSHSIFSITLTQTREVVSTQRKQFEQPQQYHRTSIISLVDLAGSERNKKSGSEGVHFREAVAINQSLTTLKNVIDALLDGRPFVPYRESTLTWLLSDSLGGNSKTFMIACVSPHYDNAEETLNTLRYAALAQQVQNRAIVNEDGEYVRLQDLQMELQQLHGKLSGKTTRAAFESRLKKAQQEATQAVERSLNNSVLITQYETDVISMSKQLSQDKINAKRRTALLQWLAKALGNKVTTSAKKLALEQQCLSSQRDQVDSQRKHLQDSERALRDNKDAVASREQKLSDMEAALQDPLIKQRSLKAEEQRLVAAVGRKEIQTSKITPLLGKLLELRQAYAVYKAEKKSRNERQAAEEQLRSQNASRLEHMKSREAARLRHARKQHEELRRKIELLHQDKISINQNTINRKESLESQIKFLKLQKGNSTCYTTQEFRDGRATHQLLSREIHDLWRSELQHREQYWWLEMEQVSKAFSSGVADSRRTLEKIRTQRLQAARDAESARNTSLARQRESLDLELGARRRALQSINREMQHYMQTWAASEANYGRFYTRLQRSLRPESEPRTTGLLVEGTSFPLDENSMLLTQHVSAIPPHEKGDPLVQEGLRIMSNPAILSTQQNSLRVVAPLASKISTESAAMANGTNDNSRSGSRRRSHSGSNASFVPKNSLQPKNRTNIYRRVRSDSWFNDRK